MTDIVASDFDWAFRPASYFGGPPPLYSPNPVFGCPVDTSTAGGRVEIAHISMTATMLQDQISIWARPCKGRLTYGISQNPHFGGMSLNRRASKQPLTFRELADVLSNIRSDAGEWITSWWWDALDADRDPCAYLYVSSQFYPQIDAWYEARFAAWERARMEEEECEEAC